MATIFQRSLPVFIALSALQVSAASEVAEFHVNTTLAQVIKVPSAGEGASDGHAQTSEPVSPEKQLSDLKSRLVIQEKQLESLEGGDANSSSSDKTPSESPAAIQLRQQLLAARQQLIKLQARYTDLYPDVIAAREQVANLTRLLDAENAARHRPDVADDAMGTQVNRQEEIDRATSSIERLKQEIAEQERQEIRPGVPALVADHSPRAVLRSNEAAPRSKPKVATHGSELVQPPAEKASKPSQTSLPAFAIPPIPQVQSRRQSLKSGLIENLVLAFSGLVCLILILIFVTVARRRNMIHTCICLEEMLSDKADYLGSIPRMDSV